MQAQKLVGVTISLTSPAMVAGTTNTLTTTVSSNCIIKGRFATVKTAITNSSFATESITTDAATGLAFVPLTSTSTQGSAAAIVFGINAAGAIKVAQGPATPTALGVTTTPGAFLASPLFPELPDDFCPVAYTIARTSPSVPTFTVGSASWANNCTTFANVALLPDRPQQS